MYRHRIVLVFLLVALVLAACQKDQSEDLSSKNSTTSAEEWEINFETPIEWGECPFEAYEAEVACGFLTVPVDYLHPSGDTLRLAFAVYKTSNAEPLADPVVFVLGMPYVAQSNFLPYAFSEIYQERDLIIFDPRGMGLSDPQMACPEMQTAWFDALPGGGLSALEWEDAHTACRASLEAQSANLDAYSLTATAADLKALRVALEVTQWNLFGFGFGAYLAYEQLRIDPDGVRSLVLDGVAPIYSETPLYFAAARDVLHEVFSLCSAHEACGNTFPNLEQVFYGVVDQLNAQPVTVLATDLNSGQRSDVQVDGNLLIDLALFTVSNSGAETIGYLPRMIYQVKDGKEEELAKLVGNYIQNYDYTYQGLMTMMFCRQFPAYGEGQVSEALSSLPPGLIEYFEQGEEINHQVCPVWKPLPTKAPQPVTGSSVPILLVNGSWNWSLPQVDVDAFVNTAPDAQVVVFPQAGRFAFFTLDLMSCTQSMFIAFIEKPREKVDTTCIPTQTKITWITLP